MYILGLQNGEDSGVALMRDGEILEAVNEERFTRVKLQTGFPKLSLDYVLRARGLAIEDIDEFAYGWVGDRNLNPDYASRLSERMIGAIEADPRAASIFRRRIRNEYERELTIVGEFEREMTARGVAPEKIRRVDHHLCHAWAAFACSPFRRALVFTLDGRGGQKSSSVSKAKHREGIRELDYHLSVDSIGFLYGQVTHYLGYTPHRHEGKVTGLAAHGDARKTLPMFREILAWREGRFEANLGPYMPFYSRLEPELREHYGRYSAEDLAAGLQAHCENLITGWVRHWLDQVADGGPYDICLAGGVAANVKINQRIAETQGVRRIFVFPHMGDGGLPLGAAAYAHFLHSGESKIDLPTAYLGTSYGADEIEACLRQFSGRVRARQLDDKVRETVEMLRADKVVGYFDGRMEYGPRALGARSILYHARDASVNDWLNKRLRRTEFMPFAPVTPVEYAGECYERWQRDDIAADFMTQTYRCKKPFAKRHPAVVHVDGTARPQIVHEARNGAYYDIVRNYCEASGDRALINTSFNMHEQPIVCSPRDAVESLLLDTVDVLIMGDYAVEAA